MTRARRMPPTVREMSQALGLPEANSGVRWHLAKLQAGGYVSRVPKLARATFVTRRGYERARGLRGRAA